MRIPDYAVNGLQAFRTPNKIRPVCHFLQPFQSNHDQTPLFEHNYDYLLWPNYKYEVHDT